MEKEPPSGGSFFAGGEQKPRGAVRVRKKVSVIFYQKRKNFSAARQGYFGGEDAKSGLSPGGGRQAVLLFFRGGMRCVTRNFLIAWEHLQCTTSLCTNQLKIHTKLTDEDCAICVLQVEKQRYIFMTVFSGNVSRRSYGALFQLLRRAPFTVLIVKDVQSV